LPSRRGAAGLEDAGTAPQGTALSPRGAPTPAPPGGRQGPYPRLGRPPRFPPGGGGRYRRDGVTKPSRYLAAVLSRMSSIAPAAGSETPVPGVAATTCRVGPGGGSSRTARA